MGRSGNICGAVTSNSTGKQTFKSLKVLDAANPIDMGKNVDGSAGGTINSIDPLRR
jgi:hypothetical protein